MQNSTFFNKIFSTPVAIGIVELYSISIDNDRTNISLEFDIPELPDVIPEKWRKKDSIHVVLAFNAGILTT